MKKTLLIFITIVALLIGIAFVLRQKEPNTLSVPTETSDSTIANFPTNNTVASSSTFSTIPDTTQLAIKIKTGETKMVSNFLKDPQAHPDPKNPGYFELGNTFPQSEFEPLPAYIITYIVETQYFNIILLKEPLVDSRTEAETYLKSALGISVSDMCSLDYTVYVGPGVNENYSSKDLRFSFCPGSISLN